MIVFWIIAALLLACAMAFILLPLSRKPHAAIPITRDALNVSVYRDQLRELEADLRAGTLTQERYDEALSELERRLLDDTSAAAKSARAYPEAGRAVLVVALAVPGIAGGLYLAVGTPQALAPEQAASAGAGHGADRQQVEAMVEALAARLKKDPDSAEGWAMLARSYATLGRFPEASQAYANAAARIPDDAQLLADYADALAMAQGQRLDGEPEKLIAKALEIDPNNLKALALAGTVAFGKSDYTAALLHWERIVRVAPPESEFAQSVRASVEEARALARASGSAPPAAQAAGNANAATPTPAAPRSASISGVVKLAPELAAKVAPTDTLFVFARAAEGPRMPVAILKAQAKDLPFQFTLDDRAAMMTGSKLSDQRSVIVGARISKSGSAIAQPGDVQGYSEPVAPGASGLRIVVSEIAR